MRVLLTTVLDTIQFPSKYRYRAKECEVEDFSLFFQTRTQCRAPAGLKVGQGYTVGIRSHKAEERNPVKNTLVEIRGRA